MFLCSIFSYLVKLKIHFNWCHKSKSVQERENIPNQPETITHRASDSLLTLHDFWIEMIITLKDILPRPMIKQTTPE
jgi:hypothetical protein